MDFFDKLGKKASEAYKVTADKTGKIAKEAKLKLKVGELKSEINNIYEEIGKIVYQKHIREDDFDISKDVDEYCTRIDCLSDEIDTILKQCLELKNKKQCPKCFVEMELEAKFCPECGEKQKEIVEEPAKEVEVIESVDNTYNEEESSIEKTVEIESNVKDD